MGGRGGGGPSGKATLPPSAAPVTPAAPSLTPTQQAMVRIGEVYQGLRSGPRDFVSIADIRDRLGDRFDRATVDNALREINLMKGNNIIPQSNQKILSARDRAAFVRIGNENRLLISMSNFERPS